MSIKTKIKISISEKVVVLKFKSEEIDKKKTKDGKTAW
jgi:hypothetical protein